MTETTGEKEHPFPPLLPLADVVRVGLRALGYSHQDADVQALIEYEDERLLQAVPAQTTMQVFLDRVVGPNAVERGWKTIRMAQIPLPQEVIEVAGQPMMVHNRLQLITADGETQFRLMVELPNTKPIVAAPASALDKLNAAGGKGGFIMPGRG